LSWKCNSSGLVPWIRAYTSFASFFLISQIIVALTCLYFIPLIVLWCCPCFFVILNPRFSTKRFYYWLLNPVPSAMITYAQLNIWSCNIMAKLLMCWSMCIYFLPAFGICFLSDIKLALEFQVQWIAFQFEITYCASTKQAKMNKENAITAKLEEPATRITRARAKALGASVGIYPASKPSFKQEQRHPLRAKTKRAASDENKSASTSIAGFKHKRRAVLKDVSNIFCENSHQNCIYATKQHVCNSLACISVFKICNYSINFFIIWHLCREFTFICSYSLVAIFFFLKLTKWKTILCWHGWLTD